MRRFGDPESFLGLLEQIRALRAARPGVRSNVIVGFPGETEDDLETLCDFLVGARMDVTGVFGYSDEDGTEAETYDGKLDDDEIRARVEHVTALVEELTSQRARRADRRGRRGAGRAGRRDDATTASVEGRAAHQGPEVDGSTYLLDSTAAGRRPGPRGGRRFRGRRPLRSGAVMITGRAREPPPAQPPATGTSPTR